MSTSAEGTLVLGIGNVLMGDEGVGVHVVREVRRRELPAGVTCLDGGTGSFQLLGPLAEARRVIMIDATIDGEAAGTVTRLQPRFSSDYPPTLTAHDIGLKDLLDTFQLLGGAPEVTLFTVSISPPPGLGLEMTAAVAVKVPEIAARVVDEIDGYPQAREAISRSCSSTVDARARRLQTRPR